MSKPQSGLISMYVLGNGPLEAPASLLMQTDHVMLLFNCPESTQRTCFANGIKMSKLDHIFLTQPKWQHIGGLLGLSLTLQGMGVPTLTIHSTISMTKFYKLTRSFSDSKMIQVFERNPDMAGEFQNSDITISSMRITSNKQSESGGHKKLRRNLTPVSCYLAKLSNVSGTLDYYKCMTLKVPRGPLLARLKEGKDVTLEDGSIVRSEDVVGPEIPGCYFLISDCPSVDYIDSLKSQESLKPFYSGSNNLLKFIFHFAPHEVTQTDEYKAWMKQFPEATTHVMLNESNVGTPNIEPAIMQEKLRMVDTDVFPPIKVCNNFENNIVHSDGVLKPLPMLKLNLRSPNKEEIYSTDKLAPFLPGTYMGIATDLPGVKESIAEYQKKISTLPNYPVYPCVTFFGTASALPGKERNTSAIWIDLSENHSILLDCAEGTLGQMIRLFDQELDEKLKKLKAVYVSHLHADHHLGLMSILQRRKQVTDEPITLLLPLPVINWLSQYNHEFEEIEHLYKIINNDQFLTNRSLDTEILMNLGLKQFKTVRVRHARDSFGVCLTTMDDFKIVYSGDAMPSVYLANTGKGADLLIHEATMEDGLEDEALDKCHSTVSQAIEVGREMQAKNIILTHFSQRYAKIPLVTKEVMDDITHVSFAFDNMRVRRCDLPRLPLMINPLRAIFKKYEEDMMLRTHKKQQREKLKDQILEEKEQKN